MTDTATTVRAYGVSAADAPVAPLDIPRRALAANDVHIAIDYCGVCHSDIHTARNDWGNAQYPVVPGHEIVGRVSAVGGGVSKFRVGDLVGVGCMVDSCLSCEPCSEGEEQYCTARPVMTYNGRDAVLGGPTFGGYSTDIVVREEFVVHIPDSLDVRAVPPLLCAGITTFSPLNFHKVGPGDRVGVIGLGGLGHLGVKFAVAMGATVTVLTRSPGKEEDARELGADVLVTTDRDAFKAARGSFDYLLDTVPVAHPLNPYMALLKRNGILILVGAIEPIEGLHGGYLIGGRKAVVGSSIGGIAETQEMLDFCAEHGIVSDIEMTEMKDINTAWERVVASDVRYRFVIDMDSLRTG